MPTPQDYIQDRAPTLFNNTAHMNNLVASVTGRVSPTAFQVNAQGADNTSLAIALLAMHIWTLENRGSGQPGQGAGGIDTMMENGVMVKYSGLTRGELLVDAILASTAFGGEYLELRAGNICGLPSRGSVFAGIY